ncbi:uncharacterized protein LOC131845944 [Achroia grisella]|uniref:uncharacterized protein LOC131845944 n=1 Tax=Achroia grisella TaxID=688607 RepID=UPI0027D2B552|nr:uncharacterized protein LOC131845944 [Achroia grisella]
MEASARFPVPRRSYADMTSTPQSNMYPSQASIAQLYDHPPLQSPYSSPQKTVSYRKTVYNSPRPHAPLGKSYDAVAHNNITQTPKSTQPNGCALTDNQKYIETTPLPTPNDNLIELLTCTLINIISKFSEALPPNVTILVQQLLTKLIVNNGPVSPTVEQLQAILGTIPSPLIVLGDFNCHHTMWGSHFNDPLSSSLLDLLDDLNLCVLNDGSATRRIAPTQNPSSPDLSLASPTLINKLIWHILPNSYAADDSIPIKNSTINKICSPPWWDNECTTSVKQRKDAENTYALNLTMDNYLAFRKICASTKRLLAKKKKIGWQKFCESLSPRTHPSVVWKKLNSFRKGCTSVEATSNDPLPWLNNLYNNLAPPFAPSQDCLPIPSPPVSNDRMDEPFSYPELCCALDHLRDSSPGIDGIPYSFIHRISISAKKKLLEILNAVFVSGNVPESWKTQIVVPILKPGKDASDASSYRPIALSSVLAKIMEHLLKNRLEWILENKNLLPNSQFGFRRGRGTIDSLSILTNEVRLAFSKNQHLIGVFLDVSSAYDNVQLPILRQKLQKLSIPARLTNIICNLFMARSISLRFQGSLHPPRLVWKGLPQGSVLSPLLFNLYTCDLETSVSCFCNTLQYADDIALYLASDSLPGIVSGLNNALWYLHQWLEDHGLALSIPKCTAVVFTRKRQIPPIHLSLNGQNIKTEDKVKFLGIILDSKLSGLHHLTYISNKCESAINVLKALSGVRWGSHPYSQKLLYNSIVRSHFDYGCFLLEPSNKIALAKLDRIQSRCLRLVLGAMKSSPNNAVQVECVDPPLQLRRQFLSDRFFLNAYQYNDHPLVAALETLSDLASTSAYWSRKDPSPILKSFHTIKALPYSIIRTHRNPIFEYDYNSLIFHPTVHLNFNIQKHSITANQDFNKIIEEYFRDWVLVYTDASKLSNDGNTGAAVWIPKYNILLSFKCPPPTSIVTGESIAILEAVLYVESHQINKTLILSDSLSCLQDIQKYPFHAKNNSIISLEIRQSLYKCHNSGINVALAWIPSHSGIIGNESVDSWARQAVSMGNTTHNKCYARDLRAQAKPQLMQAWHHLWQKTRLEKGKYYGSIQPEIPSKPWFFSQRSLDKWVTSVICRLRLGHICTPTFLFKIRVRDHSLCECGLDEGTLEHIFFTCQNLSVPLYDMLPRNIARPINIPFLLTLAHSPLVKILAKFIAVNNIKI